MRRNVLCSLVLLTAALATLPACASVPMAPPEADAASKTFAPPPEGSAGVYVFRDCFAGKSLKKSLWLDGDLVGATANKVFFHRHVTPGVHKLSTESEFGNNDLEFTAVAGTNHFFEQYIKMGVFAGGAALQAVSEESGKQSVLACGRALDARDAAASGASKPATPPANQQP